MTLVYLVQGLTDVAWLAEKYFLKDELGASPAQVSLILSMASLPWMAKPLLGFLSDSLPLWGYRRRSYLMLASATAALSWLYLSLGCPSLPASLAALLCCSGAGALSDVVVDSMVVERAREEQQDSAGSLQSLCWGAYAVGQVATAAVSGGLVQREGPRLVFALTAAFPLLIGAASLLLHEERQGEAQGDLSGNDTKAVADVPAPAALAALPAAPLAGPATVAPATADDDPGRCRKQPGARSDSNSDTGRTEPACADTSAGPPGSRAPHTHPLRHLAGRAASASASMSAARARLSSQGSALWSALSSPAISGPVSFLVLLSATPSADDAVFFWQVEALGFSPAFLGGVQLAGALASLAGVVLYQSVLQRVPLRSLLLWGSLVGGLLRSTDLLLVTRANTLLGLDDHLFVLGGSVVTSVIANVMAMPTLVLAARLCPRGLEATMFATLMSLLNMAEAMRFAGGAVLMGALGVGGQDGSYEQLPALVGLCDAALLLPLPLLAGVPASLEGGAPAGEAAAEGVAAEVGPREEAPEAGVYPVPVPVAAATTAAMASVASAAYAAAATRPHQLRATAAQRRRRRQRQVRWRLHGGANDAVEQLAHLLLPTAGTGALPGELWPAAHGPQMSATTATGYRVSAAHTQRRHRNARVISEPEPALAAAAAWEEWGRGEEPWYQHRWWGADVGHVGERGGWAAVWRQDLDGDDDDDDDDDAPPGAATPPLSLALAGPVVMAAHVELGQLGQPGGGQLAGREAVVRGAAAAGREAALGGFAAGDAGPGAPECDGGVLPTAGGVGGAPAAWPWGAAGEHRARSERGQPVAPAVAWGGGAEAALSRRRGARRVLPGSEEDAGGWAAFCDWPDAGRAGADEDDPRVSTCVNRAGPL